MLKVPKDVEIPIRDTPMMGSFVSGPTIGGYSCPK